MANATGRKAPIARSKTNLIVEPEPPREYICLIGGCTNTFNGWFSGIHDPANWDSFLFHNPMPPPLNRLEIDYYLNTPKAVDLDLIDKSQWKKYGWSEYGVAKLKENKLNAKDLRPAEPETHDRYWANFVDAATRLYLNKEALPAPHQRPHPRKGDIVTFFIYYPAYRKRQDLDWAASPHNFKHHDKYEAARYWGQNYPKVKRIELPDRVWRTPTQAAQDAKEKKKLAETLEADKTRRLSEDDINFYILMRRSLENTDRTIWRSKNGNDYFEYLRGDYEGGPLGTVYDYGALSKIFFFRDKSELIQYLQTGKWEGEEWTDGLNPDSSTNEDGTAAKVKNYVFMPSRPLKTDAHGRPFKIVQPWCKAWDKTPGVDRRLIKIHRFDYFGHSDPGKIMLEYGWDNKKGEMPHSSCVLPFEDLEKCFDGKVLTRNPSAGLWGCSLGGVPADKSPAMSQRLADKYFSAGVVASEHRTTFEHILEDESKMPEPLGERVWSHAEKRWVSTKGKWTLYSGGQKQSVGE